MKKIIKSSVELIKPYRNKRHNHPVNLDNVKTMTIGNGTVDYNKCFNITFNFLDGGNEAWLYMTKEERDRDWNHIDQVFVYNLGDD